MSLLARRIGAGPPLVLIHGYTVDHRIMLPLDGALDGWTRLYLDLPGHGGSSGAAVNSADDVAAAVGEWVASSVTGPFAVVGNSFGGMIARHLVAEFGDRVLGLALLAPMVRLPGERVVPPRQVFTTDDALLASLTEEDREEFAAVAVDQTPAAWETFRDAVTPGLRAHDPAAAARIWSRYGLSIEPETRFATFDGPSLLLTGRQDDQVGFADQLALLPSYPRMTATVLDRAGHNAHLDRPDLVGALMRDWLDRMS